MDIILIISIIHVKACGDHPGIGLRAAYKDVDHLLTEMAVLSWHPRRILVF